MGLHINAVIGKDLVPSLLFLAFSYLPTLKWINFPEDHVEF